MRRKKQDVRGCGRGKERERKRNLQAGRLWIHDLNWLDPVAVFQAELEREKGWLNRKESRQRRGQSQFCEERARCQTYSSGGLFPHAIHTASSSRRVESGRVESQAVPCRAASGAETGRGQRGALGLFLGRVLETQHFTPCPAAGNCILYCKLNHKERVLSCQFLSFFLACLRIAAAVVYHTQRDSSRVDRGFAAPTRRVAAAANVEWLHLPSDTLADRLSLSPQPRKANHQPFAYPAVVQLFPDLQPAQALFIVRCVAALVAIVCPSASRMRLSG